MRFLADAGVAGRVTEWLRQRGHDAVHLRDQRLERSSDAEVFAKASSETRVLLTFDLDFGEIVALAASPKASVIMFRLHDTRTPRVIERLEKVLSDVAAQLERGAIVVVEEARHRVRAHPQEAEE